MMFPLRWRPAVPRLSRLAFWRGSTIILWFLLQYLMLTSLAYSQTTGTGRLTLSGYLRDKASGETMVGATVTLVNANGQVVGGANSNEYGFYSLSVERGQYTLRVQYIGYTPISQSLDLSTGNQRLDLTLTENSQVLEEVQIVGRAVDANVTSLDVGRNELSIEQIKSVPALFGEVDVMKVIQLLPGIASTGEGTTGFNVRGGSFDQNLILLDEAPVYNASHLLGFFSVFNSDAIKGTEIYKSGIPASYGGRLSSVVDIRMREGNNQRFSGQGGIGLLAARATIEGPIQKDRSSFIISGRRTYADAFLALSSDSNIQNTRLYFYDLNAKANFQLSENNTIFVSGYFGRDVFRSGDEFSFDWGNATATVRWNHVFNPRLFSNVTAIFSDFNYKIGFSTGSNSGGRVTSGIQDVTLKADFSYFPSPKITTHFGVQATWHTFKPGELEPTGTRRTFNPSTIEEQRALEAAVYADGEQTISPRLALRYGLRLSSFSIYGPGNVNTYNQAQYNNPLIQTPEIVSTRRYNFGELIQRYIGWEPRASLRYLLNETSSIKASYDRTYQYIHIASNAGAGLPTDLWIPSSDYIRPQSADQFALGYYRNFGSDNKKRNYEASMEVYYKTMDNQLDLRDGADITLNPNIETQLRQGVGRSYGAEWYIQKHSGKLTGWLSYTLSKTERRIEIINNNNWYPAKADRRHNIALVGMYNLNKRWSFGGNFVYYTGQAVTFPAGRFIYEGNAVPIYSERNAFRLPDYHRLDLSATLQGKNNDSRRWKTEWVFSIYNVYSRQNAFYVTFRQKEDEPGVTEAKLVYLFPILPSVTYNIRF